MKVTISINKMIRLNLCCSIIQQYFQRNCWFTIEQIKVSRYTIQDDSDPRSRLIATRRPKEGLLLVSVKSYKYRILINDSIRPCPGGAQISPRMDKTYEDVLSYYKKKITLSQQFYYQTLIFSFTLSYLFARHLKDFHELIIVINISSKRSWSVCVKSKDCWWTVKHLVSQIHHCNKAVRVISEH